MPSPRPGPALLAMDCAAIRAESRWRSAAVLGLGIIGQFALRSLLAAGACPVIGIDVFPCAGCRGRRAASTSIWRRRRLDQLRLPRASGAEIVADATGVPDAVPLAMSLACDAARSS